MEVSEALMRLDIDELEELEEFVVLAQSILEIFEAGVTAGARMLGAPMTELCLKAMLVTPVFWID